MTTSKNALLKVAILGDGVVGKTCLMNRFVSDTFDAPFRTIGVEFSSKVMSLDDTNFTIQIWDTAGQERFKSLRTPFYRGSDICLLCFAVDNEESFQNLETWKKEFFQYADIRDPSSFPFIVVATKIDLTTREVSESQARAWCQANGNLGYIETSAKNSINVTQAFEMAIRAWLERESALELDHHHGLGRPISLHDSKKSSSCC